MRGVCGVTYDEAKRAAQAAADESGFDYGVEKLGRDFRYFMLPQKQNRFGHELRCEIVHCTTLAKCQKGHGP
jgi:hypothetical protein